ncbi:MAG: hypothetical protein ACI81I_000815, partial [Arcobacteraceae bacterium]
MDDINFPLISVLIIPTLGLIVSMMIEIKVLKEKFIGLDDFDKKIDKKLDKIYDFLIESK